jgi:tetratricopeptide (TPR) repeat protein
LAVYLPSLRSDFLTFDDQHYETENPHVQPGLTIKGLVWAFGFHAGNWHPLTWLSHMLDCQLYGLHPAGHHLTNVLLHTACTVLLFLVLSRMTAHLWPSAFVAALFGWHPLHVESVAWVAERKDVLSAFFFMLTLLAYANYASTLKGQGSSVEGRNAQSPKVWYAVSLFLFALALMSKPMVVTLPFVLLLLDYWPLGRLQIALGPSDPVDNRTVSTRSPCPLHWAEEKRVFLLLEKLTFLVMAAITCVLTIKAQTQFHAVVSTAGLPITTRASHAVLSYAHYIGAMFLPGHLAVFYPYDTAASPAKIIAAGLMLGLISMAAAGFRRKRPYLLVGWLWFLGTLVPVIGLVQVGEQAWADRYTYLPLVGLFMAVVWLTATVFERRASVDTATRGAVEKPGLPANTKVGRGVLTAQCIALFTVGIPLLTLTSLQLRYWKNTRTLFEHAAAVTHHNYMAITLLGSLSAKDGKPDEAIERYHIALGWKPDYPEAHFFLGNALDQQGKLDAAIAQYQQALWFKPIQEQTHIFLGAALFKQQKHDEAAGHYLAALKLNPESAVAHNNLARLLQTEGRLDEAVEHYSAALRSDPGMAQAHNNLGVLMLARGRTADGVRELREAVRLNPNDPEPEYNLALALNQQKQWAEAAGLLAKIAAKRPTAPNVHYQCAVALSHLGKTREAMTHYASALLIQPDFPDALDGLAWTLATSVNPAFRNGTEAVRMAERACQLTSRKDPEKLKTLAAAYAEVGRFPEAVSTIQSAEAGATSSNSTTWESMLKIFKSGQPWREPEVK